MKKGIARIIVPNESMVEINGTTVEVTKPNIEGEHATKQKYDLESGFIAICIAIDEEEVT